MQSKGPELLVGAETIDSPTEFVILASTGIWEVRCVYYIHFFTLRPPPAIFPTYFLCACKESSTSIFVLFIQVMNDQEAVLLIRDIYNPQIAAEYLANEALNRRSKSRISCLIIRFN